MNYRARRWVHCSAAFHGLTWVADRRAPVSRGKDEPDTPRLCVARSVASCMAATFFSGDMYVYLTEAVAGLEPVNVWDAPITGEAWIDPPVTLHLDHVMPAQLLANYRNPYREALAEVGSSNIRMRHMALASAIQALDGQTSNTVPLVTATDRHVLQVLQEYLVSPAPSVR